MRCSTHFSAVPLDATQAAALPALLVQHHGNEAAVARQLGVSRQAIHKRIMKEGLRPPSPPRPEPVDPVVASTKAEEERQMARGLLVQAGKLAHENPTVDDLVKAARELINLANSRDKAHQLALTYVDQRSLTVQGQGATEADLDRAADRLMDRVWARLCPGCRVALGGEPVGV